MRFTCLSCKSELTERADHRSILVKTSKTLYCKCEDARVYWHQGALTSIFGTSGITVDEISSSEELRMLYSTWRSPSTIYVLPEVLPAKDRLVFGCKVRCTECNSVFKLGDNLERSPRKSCKCSKVHFSLVTGIDISIGDLSKILSMISGPWEVVPDDVEENFELVYGPTSYSYDRDSYRGGYSGYYYVSGGASSQYHNKAKSCKAGNGVTVGA